ncbi:MAG: (d)CMP kinase [Chloroflexota bacterium]
MVGSTDNAPSREPVVAVDGPGSSGKTSVGAAAAARLRLRFCDTGLFYRAVTFAARRQGIPAADADGLVALVGGIRLEADGTGRYAVVTLDGEDVTAGVHTPDVDAAVSDYARVPELRTALLGRQRDIAAQGGVVMAGRDIGTVVLPDADIKIYLDASVEERARRRADERGVASDDPEAAEILDQLRSRDARDASRPTAPLRRAEDALVIRTDTISFAETVDRVVEAIEAARREKPGVAHDVVPASSAMQTERVAIKRRKPTAPTPIATRITWIIRIASFVMRVVTRFFTRVVIEGDIAVIPRAGAVLIAANHASNADPVLIGGFLDTRLGRPINWMGKREVFEWPLISWLARHGGVHPVDRGAADVEAFRTAMRILGGGHMLAVFPEGTRSPDGRLQPAKDGVAVLATRSNALIVPIGIGNSDRLWPRGRRLPLRTPEVIVRIGEPFHLADALAAEERSGTDAGDGREDPADRAEAASVASRRRTNAAGTDLIMRRIAALLPARQRGGYGEPIPD